MATLIHRSQRREVANGKLDVTAALAVFDSEQSGA
jgi:hypothetical protein